VGGNFGDLPTLGRHTGVDHVFRDVEVAKRVYGEPRPHSAVEGNRADEDGLLTRITWRLSPGVGRRYRHADGKKDKRNMARPASEHRSPRKMKYDQGNAAGGKSGHCR